MLVKRLLVSLAVLGIAGSSGAGIYYGTKKFSENSVETQTQIPFSGSLIFSKKDKTNNTDSTNSKVYEAELSNGEEDFSEGEKCKFEQLILKCKVSNLDNKEKVEKYLEELNKKLIDSNSDDDSELTKKLKEKLIVDKLEFEKFFSSEIYTNIEKKLPSSD